ILAFCPPVLDRHVTTFDKTGLIQALVERSQEVRESFSRPSVKEADHLHRRLLGVRRERPRGCRAAEQRDELASSHSMTSSARASSVGGTSRPSVFAVCRFMMNSNLVG